MPTIRIDDEVYSWLKSLAVPFEDTPNSVLRRLAKLSSKPALAAQNQAQIKMNATSGWIVPIQPAFASEKRVRGNDLARLWNVQVVQARYHKDGKKFNVIRHFPGALFDADGYIRFESEAEYLSNPSLVHGQELTVPGGISSLAGYRRIKKQ